MSMSRLLLFFDAFVGIIITVVASNIVSLEPEDVCKAFEISLQVEGGIGNVTPQAEWPTVCQQPEGNRHHAHKEPPGPPEHASTYPLLPSRNSSSPPSSPGTGAFDFGDCDRAPTVQCLASKKAAFLVIYWASFAALAHTVYLTHLVAFRGVEELPVFPVYFLHICLAVSLGIMPTLVPVLQNNPVDAMRWFFANSSCATAIIFIMAIVLYHQVGRGSPENYEQRRFLRARAASRALILTISFLLSWLVLSSINPAYSCK